MQNADARAVLTACSLYLYNVNPGEIAQKIVERTGDPPEEADYLVGMLSSPRKAFWPTELPEQSAQAFTELALEKYYNEALRRNRINRGG